MRHDAPSWPTYTLFAYCLCSLRRAAAPDADRNFPLSEAARAKLRKKNHLIGAAELPLKRAET